jgi:hypothetical protein
MRECYKTKGKPQTIMKQNIVKILDERPTSHSTENELQKHKKYKTNG